MRYVTQSTPPLSFFSPDKTNPKQTNSLHLFHPLWFSANGKCEDDTQYAAGSMQNNIFTSSNSQIPLKYYPNWALDKNKTTSDREYKNHNETNSKKTTKTKQINSFEGSCTRAQENFKRNQNYKKKNFLPKQIFKRIFLFSWFILICIAILYVFDCLVRVIFLNSKVIA